MLGLAITIHSTLDSPPKPFEFSDGGNLAFFICHWHGGDRVWIKMRTNLRRLPKLLVVATELHQNPESMRGFSVSNESDGVTFDCVTRVTVASLLDLWGDIQELIDEENYVDSMTLAHVDTVSGIPGFGAALEKVGWIEVRPNGLVFNNFHQHNVPVKERSQPMTGAERMRRWRDKKKGVTGVTKSDASDAQSRVEESNINPPTPLSRRGGRGRRSQDPLAFKKFYPDTEVCDGEEDQSEKE